MTVAFVKLSRHRRRDRGRGTGGAARAHRRRSRPPSARRATTYGVTWLESDIDVGRGQALPHRRRAVELRARTRRGCCARSATIVAADVGLPLRAGVNRGHVFTGDIGSATRRTYAVMGDAVNLAARLTARAQPGDILATARRARPRAHDLRDRDASRCSSRARSAPSRRTTSASRSARATTPSADATPIVGRERRARAAPATRSTRARMRQLQVVELVGEPGIGKSRLVRELRTLALGFTQLDARRRAVRVVDAVLRAGATCSRQLAGITPDRSPRAGRRAARAVGRRA